MHMNNKTYSSLYDVLETSNISSLEDESKLCISLANLQNISN